MKTMYFFKGFRLEYDSETGDAFTRYDDGAVSRRPLVEDDKFHADKLKIKPEEHALLHELTHHCLAVALGEDTCPIIKADAHGMDMPEDAQSREWVISTVSYFAMRTPPANAGDWGAIIDIQRLGVNIHKLSNEIVTLYLGFSTENVDVFKRNV